MTAERPEPGRPPPFPLPPRDSFQLASGLSVTLVQSGSVPKSAVRLSLRAGTLNEAPGKPWLARLSADYLKEGTARLSAAALADTVAGLGGRLRVGADDDSTDISARVLSQATPDLVRLLAEVVREPAFPASEIERLRADALRMLSLVRAEPRIITGARFARALYGDHPYGRGLPEDGEIEALGVEDVRAFWTSEAGASRASLYIAGRFDAAAVAEAARDAFDGWDPGAAPLELPPSPRSERAVHMLDRPGAEQTTIYLGLPVPDPSHVDYVPLLVTDALLGGSFASRITANIREDKGYTYSPHSVISTRRRDAHWVQVADVTTDVTGASLYEIFEEIDRLRREPPPPDELRGIQNYVVGTHVLRQATPAGLIGQIAFMDLHGLGEEYATGFADRVFEVTPDEVQRLAREYLRPEDMAIAVAGDAEQIVPQLEPYGPVVT